MKKNPICQVCKTREKQITVINGVPYYRAYCEVCDKIKSHERYTRNQAKRQAMNRQGYHIKKQRAAHYNKTGELESMRKCIICLHSFSGEHFEGDSKICNCCEYEESPEYFLARNPVSRYDDQIEHEDRRLMEKGAKKINSQSNINSTSLAAK